MGVPIRSGALGRDAGEQEGWRGATQRECFPSPPAAGLRGGHLVPRAGDPTLFMLLNTPVPILLGLLCSSLRSKEKHSLSGNFGPASQCAQLTEIYGN